MDDKDDDMMIKMTQDDENDGIMIWMKTGWREGLQYVKNDCRMMRRMAG